MDDEASRKEIGEVLVHILNVWIRLMSPFVPHAAEELWSTHGGEGFASEASWPQYDPDLIDEKVQKSEEIVQELANDINEIKTS